MVAWKHSLIPPKHACTQGICSREIPFQKNLRWRVSKKQLTTATHPFLGQYRLKSLIEGLAGALGMRTPIDYWGGNTEAT